MQDFPEELRGDVSMHLHNEILGLPIFDTAPEGCKKLLSIKVQIQKIADNSQLVYLINLPFCIVFVCKTHSFQIRTNFCAPDEFLIHKGDAIQNIYYIRNGSMEVLQEGMVVAILGKIKY